MTFIEIQDREVGGTGHQHLQKRLQPIQSASWNRLYLYDSIGRGGEIRTHDPLRPRRFTVCRQKRLFSTASVSMGWRELVEVCGSLLKPEASPYHRFIYSELCDTMPNSEGSRQSEPRAGATFSSGASIETRHRHVCGACPIVCRCGLRVQNPVHKSFATSPPACLRVCVGSRHRDLERSFEAGIHACKRRRRRAQKALGSALGHTHISLRRSAR
jgi:hypothetical protein